MVTLHHFVQPLWFDRMGGFTASDTIPHFVRFAEFAYRCWHFLFGVVACHSSIWKLTSTFPPLSAAGDLSDTGRVNVLEASQQRQCGGLGLYFALLSWLMGCMVPCGREFGRKVHLWITFNEANVMVRCCACRGQPHLTGIGAAYPSACHF